MNEGIRPGSGYRVRLDEVAPGSGAIRSRAEVPFEAASAASAGLPAAGSPTAVTTPKVPTAVVSRGDSLWRISRAAYGDGARYTVIFYSDPNLIRHPYRI